MVSASTVIKSPSDLHLRPAGTLCREALLHKSKVSPKICTITADAKSVLSVLGACMEFRGEITLVCEGPGEKEALAAMVKIVEDGLGE